MFNYEFGVEIEIAKKRKNGEEVVKKDIEKILKEKGLEWRVIKDMSCGYEAVSPILGEEDLWEIKEVCQSLKNYGAKVDENCGLHVHLNAQNCSLRHLRSVILHWKAAEESLFDTLVDETRQGDNNYFCQRVKFEEDFVFSKDSIMDLAEAVPTRYYKLNLRSFLQHGTIEFRSFNGTLDEDSIIGWVTLLQNFYHYCSFREPRLATYFAELSGEEQIQTIEVAIAKKSARDNKHFKMRDLKQAVYKFYGVTNTKDLRKKVSIPLDLRKKDSWLSLFNATLRDRNPSNSQPRLAPVISISQWSKNRSLQLLSA